jgi:hypothetical protein
MSSLDRAVVSISGRDDSTYVAAAMSGEQDRTLVAMEVTGGEATPIAREPLLHSAAYAYAVVEAFTDEGNALQPLVVFSEKEAEQAEERLMDLTEVSVVVVTPII